MGSAGTALVQRVFDACRLQGAFMLRSGQTSREYFDKYLFETDPALLAEVAQAMVELLPPCDVLAGMEMGGIPLVVVLSQHTGKPAVFVRKAAKTYGTAKAVEGVDVDGRLVVAVEDVVTTAGALVTGCQHLRRAGAIVDTAVCAIDRDQGGAAALAAAGITLRAAIDRFQLDQVARSMEPGPVAGAMDPGSDTGPPLPP